MAVSEVVVAKGECVVLREGRLVKADLAELESDPADRWEVVDLTKVGRYTVALNDAPGGITLFAGRPCIRIEETPKGNVATPQLDEPGHLWLVGKGGVTWKGTKFPAGSIVEVGKDRQPKAHRWSVPCLVSNYECGTCAFVGGRPRNCRPHLPGDQDGDLVGAGEVTTLLLVHEKPPYRLH